LLNIRNWLKAQSRRRLAVAGGFILVVLLSYFLVSARRVTVTVSPSERPYWPTGDWREASPEAMGVDPLPLKQLDQYVQDSLPNIHGVLVVHRGYLVFEKYYQGGDADLKFEVASVTKSVTSALIGIAIQKGYLRDLDQTLNDFFPEALTNVDPRVKTISIKNLLTMRPGFAWSEESAWSWPRDGDWINYILTIPMGYAPGEKFIYTSPAVHLLSGILTKTTRMSALDFADKYLFGPLGIRERDWLTDDQGRSTGAHGLFLRMRDAAKIGFLYLNQGYWNGRQLVPAGWVADSTRRQSEGGFPEYTGYGYLWWLTTNNGYDAFYAAGYGGQYVYVVPDLDLVAVIVSKNDLPHPENKTIIGQFIIPAIRG
jgi:CubicO group peptidase (beta-lactamase class C family)